MTHCELNPSAHILDKLRPSLASRLAALPLAERRAVAAKACKQAAESIQNLESEMAALVDRCVRENHLSPAQVAAAHSFAKWADERYFDLKDSGVHEDVWGTWFHKARLATAVAEAFGGESWESTASAIYELAATMDDPSPLMGTVESGIGEVKP
jgi:hypothetical protein